MRLTVVSIAFALAIGWTSTAHAQTIVSVFGSANVHTTPGFTDLDDVATDAHAGFGVSAATIFFKSWLGAEGEIALTPSAFAGHDLVETGRLSVATASVLAASSPTWHVRPYFSFGAGIAQIKSVDVAKLFVVDSSHSVMTASAGVWAWITPRLGIRGGIRFIRSLDDIESDSLETWQPSVGVSFRF